MLASDLQLHVLLGLSIEKRKISFFLQGNVDKLLIYLVCFFFLNVLPIPYWDKVYEFESNKLLLKFWLKSTAGL